MTITLEPEAETALRKTLQRTGQEPDAVVSHLVLATLTQMEEQRAEDAAAIQEAMEDVRAGRERPYKEYMAEMRQKYPQLGPSVNSARSFIKEG